MLQTGFNRYNCDVSACSKAKYAQPNSTAAAEYTIRSFIDVNGETITSMFCKEHAADFDALVTKHDAEFAAFLKNGTAGGDE